MSPDGEADFLRSLIKLAQDTIEENKDLIGHLKFVISDTPGDEYKGVRDRWQEEIDQYEKQNYKLGEAVEIVRRYLL